MKKFNLKLILALILLIFVLCILFNLFSKNLAQRKKEGNNSPKILTGQKKQTQEELDKIIQEKIYLTGKFNPSANTNFSLIPLFYTVNQNKMYLRKETFSAFLNMAELAKKDGVDLKIASATRNFIDQKKIWNDKWSGFTLVNNQNLSKTIKDGNERFKKILEYSSVPGTSRHHFGTDIDINDANPEYFETKTGEKIYNWLVKNAPSFGFCQPYNKKGDGVGERNTGYNEEKWHWSYLPLSKNFTQEYKNLITNQDIKGFYGDEYVPKFNLINDYVLGINPECL